MEALCFGETQAAEEGEAMGSRHFSAGLLGLDVAERVDLQKEDVRL